MKKRSFKFYLRKTHRYLGVFIGVQFFLWTLGGLYFSWTKIDEIRGDHLRRKNEVIKTDYQFISPKNAIDELQKSQPEIKIVKFQLLEVLRRPFYEIKYELPDKSAKTVLVSAINGEIRQPISEKEAEEIAANALKTPLLVKDIEYLTEKNVNAHHEYREKPLPAWAITFAGKENLTVYVAEENGNIGAFRTNDWRLFDFLWMLHTLGFSDRDNINNYLLRSFSVLGIVTILSGFALFFVSSVFFRKLISRKRRIKSLEA